ncbi:MAG: urease accessory UreF family protein [Candidatus Acidiferrales bacterium]
MESEAGRAVDPHDGELSELRLLHLADSALPIGGLAHSFGLESLTARDVLRVADLPAFLRGFLEEAGLVEAVFCRAAYALAGPNTLAFSLERWIELNDSLSARKPARESCAGSAALGENFLRAVLALGDFPVLREAGLVVAKRTFGEPVRPASDENRPVIVHHSTAFGLASGVLRIDEDRAVRAFLHQLLASLVSACQRLLPLGQSAATRILWDLKPAMIHTAGCSAACSLDDACSFTPVLDWGAMEHPALTTRLFIS